LHVSETVPDAPTEFYVRNKRFAAAILSGPTLGYTKNAFKLGIGEQTLTVASGRMFE